LCGPAFGEVVILCGPAFGEVVILYYIILYNVVGSREGWELYIVTDRVMVGILLGERWELYIDRRRTSSVNIQLPPFSTSHNIGHYLSMFISDSLMMAF
jgi:hypothetical protein